jgi:hypothetical protein
MATRLYFSRTGTGISPTLQGAWDSTPSVVRGGLSRVKDTLASTTLQVAETDASPTFDVFCGQWISVPIDTAQTISGLFDLCTMSLETNADAQMVLHVHVWVTEGDTSVVRGTLLTDYIDTHELPTTEAGVAITQQTLSGVAASVGDRIVVEIGYQAQNTLTASRSGRVRHGGNAATDQSAGDTDSTHPGWCEFATTITDAEVRVDWQEKWYPGGNTQDSTIVPPLTRGAWTVTGSVSLALADALKTATPGVASAAIGLSTGATTQFLTRLLQYFVSPPLNAGTIPASTFMITGLALENAVDQDIVWCVYAYLMEPNGDVRAVLIDLGADADADNEWPITTAAGRTIDGIAVSSQAITQDDRLVLEVGGKQLGTPAAAGTITMRRGGTGADAQVGDTDTTKASWLIFQESVSASPRRPTPIFVGL